MAKMGQLGFCCFPLAGSSPTVGKGTNSQGNISYGFSLLKGDTNHPIEDYHVANFIHMRDRQLGLFGIFDGHLGDSVAQYLQRNLFTNILKEEEFWTQPDVGIRRGYRNTDSEMLSEGNLGRGGSTAVTVLIDGTKLWVANVGDSRAILAKRGGVIQQMTVDHDANSERDIIEARGGFVSNLPGDVGRVNGQLAVSRAFGDKNLKTIITSDPDIHVADINSEIELLILASDGIWKVMSNEEAVNFARQIKDPQTAAKKLTLEAFRKDDKDDISCIVIRFNR